MLTIELWFLGVDLWIIHVILIIMCTDKDTEAIIGVQSSYCESHDVWHHNLPVCHGNYTKVVCLFCHADYIFSVLIISRWTIGDDFDSFYSVDLVSVEHFTFLITGYSRRQLKLLVLNLNLTNFGICISNGRKLKAIYRMSLRYMTDCFQHQHSNIKNILRGERCHLLSSHSSIYFLQYLRRSAPNKRW